MLNNLFHNRKQPGSRAQAMVEFAIVAPILFLMLLGIIEVGRMIFLYAAVTNASREAVRFGSAIGYDDVGVLKYKHCAKIREVARKASYFISIPDSAITIDYDNGPGTTVMNPSPCRAGVAEAPGYFVKSGDRIIVTVTGQYAPYTSIIPWGSRSFVSSSSRTILGFVALKNSGGGGGGGGGATDTPTATEDPFNPWTATPTNTEGPSPTPTDTLTATITAEVMTLTPMATSTPTYTTTATTTSTVTSTPTATYTPTSTFTPTSTPTAVPGCNQIVAGDIILQGTTMTMSIRNPHTPVTVSTVQLKWNATSGGTGNPKTLSLIGASLGGPFWPSTPGVTNSSGDLTITPSTTVTIPGNNATSTIVFYFDKNYVKPSGESISITLSTPGCEGIIIHKP